MLEMAMLIALGKISESLFTRLGFPRVVGYVFVGLVLSFVFNLHVSSVTEAFATLGIITMLFYAGLESSFREFYRGLKDAGLIASGGVIGALLAGLLTMVILRYDFITALAIGVIYSATSVSLTVGTLEELGKLGGRESQAIIGAAVVDDVIGLALISTLYGMAKGHLPIIYVIGIALLAFGVWLSVSYVFQLASRPLFKIAFKSGIKEPLLTLTFALLLFFSYVATYIRLSAILLAYALGLGLASFRYFARRLTHEVTPIVSLFAPLFFIYAGMAIGPEEFAGFNVLQGISTIIIIVVLGIVSKVLGCYVVSRALGFSHIDSLIIGVGMTPRAEVMLVSALICYELGLITPTIYVGVILIIPVTTVLVPPLLKLMYSRKPS